MWQLAYYGYGFEKLGRKLVRILNNNPDIPVTFPEPVIILKDPQVKEEFLSEIRNNVFLVTHLKCSMKNLKLLETIIKGG